MDSSRLLLLILIVITPSEGSETAESQCEDLYLDLHTLREGEAFYYVPYLLNGNPTDEEITWYKNKTERITTDEKENVHYHGGALFFLNLVPEDSGSYSARHNDTGRCYIYHVTFKVLKPNPATEEKFLYGEIKNSDMNKMVKCPFHFSCRTLKGRLSWKKDSNLLPGRHEAELWLHNTSKKDEGIYTCVCTWTHNNKEYNSSASMRLTNEELSVHRGVEIISPTNKEQFADEGVGIKLNCSVFCGTNVGPYCKAKWNVTTHHETNEIVVLDNSLDTISTAILTIDKVSALDFKTKFQCIGEGLFKINSTTLTLKRRESIIPLVVGGVCVLIFVGLAAMLVKRFAIDLALFCRHYFPLSCYSKDARMYDAYVVYQAQGKDKVTEDKLCRFIAEILPSVLEDKCGYRLFIHGRDDIPGEDRLELVEVRMKQSRRLMVILTPGPEPGSDSKDQHPASPETSVMGGFDWQVGLHHALLQREMSVILVQLGDWGPKGYSHLPAGLQHLIQKSAPIRWPEGSRGAATWNSRFWKRVRYLMPATPARRYPQTVI